MEILSNNFVIYYNHAICQTKIRVKSNASFEFDANQIQDIYDSNGSPVNYEIHSVYKIGVTKRGKIYTGILISESDDRIIFYDDNGHTVEISNPEKIVFNKVNKCCIKSKSTSINMSETNETNMSETGETNMSETSGQMSIFTISFLYESTSWIPRLKFNIDKSLLMLKAIIVYDDKLDLIVDNVTLVSFNENQPSNMIQNKRSMLSAQSSLSLTRDTSKYEYNIIKYDIGGKVKKLSYGTKFGIILNENVVQPVIYYDIDLNNKSIQMVYKTLAPFDIPFGTSLDILIQDAEINEYPLQKKYIKGSEMKIVLPSDSMLLANITRLYDKKSNTYTYQIVITNIDLNDNSSTKKKYNLHLNISNKPLSIKLLKKGIEVKNPNITYSDQELNIALTNETKSELLTLILTYPQEPLSDYDISNE